MPRSAQHIPVLMDAVLDALRPRAGQTIVDCTLGLGGHSAELLRRVQPGGRLIGIDFDPHNMTVARQRLERTGGNFELFHDNFAALPSVLLTSLIDRKRG